MAKVRASVSRAVNAPPEKVLEFLRDYREARPSILPDNYTAYRVEEGGHGAGTVFAYHLSAGSSERDFRLRVHESDEGIFESDEHSSFVSNWTVAPSGGGSTVTLKGSWDGAGGIPGFFERVFAPLGLRRIYGQILDRLATAVS
jgi:Polyketide cyclase / dehydrase and lipid transport